MVLANSFFLNEFESFRRTYSGIDQAKLEHIILLYTGFFRFLTVDVRSS